MDRIAKEFCRFSATIRDYAGEVEGSIVWLRCVDECVETVLRFLTERETRGGQRQKQYSDTR